MARVGDKVVTQLYQAALDTEEQLDDEIDRLSKLKEDDLEEIRRKRLEAMKDQHRKAQSAIRAGCGKYDELKDEKEFFQAAKDNPRMACVFFGKATIIRRDDKAFRDTVSAIRDNTFCRINAEKSQFLSEKLHIWMLPSIVLVKDGKTEYTIRGFDELGGMDFSTERLESILSYREIIRN